MTAFLEDGPDDARACVILAHGAGAAMDTLFMDDIAAGLAGAGHRVVRFEFPYMAKSRADGRKRAPDRQPVLLDAWRQTVASVRAGHDGPVIIGGKSLGGRMASLVADELGVAGLVVLGYPFHPPGRPERLRVAHLAELATPALILQGERDPFGRRDEVASYSLAPTIELAWLPDGDHGFKPRKRSGETEAGNRRQAAAMAAAFVRRLVSGA